MSDCLHPWSHSVNGGPHRYCECGWMEPVEPEPDPRGEAIKEAVTAIHAHAEKWAPAEGNFEQKRLRRHLNMAAQVVANLDPPSLEEVAEAVRQAALNGGNE